MKQPDNIKRVTISKFQNNWIFPPLGFVEFEEGNDGAGDYYGLYWELGKEDQEAVVFRKNHEECQLIPEFVNLDSFLSWYETTLGQELPSINLRDTTFYINSYNRARVFTKTGKTKEAIHTLEMSTELFGEYSDSWGLLAENYYKLNEKDKADLASLNSIISNYAFGLPSFKSIEQFNKLDSKGNLKKNPIIKRIDGFISGGTFSNPLMINYDKLLEAIAEFKELKDYKSALILEQNYGYLMLTEKGEIREKYNFNDKEWSEFIKNEILNIYPDRKW